MDPATSDKSTNGASPPSQSDAELIARLEHSRNELMDAASVLQKPLQAVQRAENVMRRVLPVLPYAIAAITVIGVASSLVAGRRLRPALLIATGLDVWRLWKTYKMTAGMPTPHTAARALSDRRADAASRSTTGYP